MFQYCLILLQNWYFLAKTEWEKCPISDILDKLTKLLQIRQVCMSFCDNKSYPNFASKVVSYDAYHGYKLCFYVRFGFCTNLRQNVSSLLYDKMTKKSLFQLRILDCIRMPLAIQNHFQLERLKVTVTKP